MSWNDILGHDDVLARFRQAAQRGRIASTYLFVGPPGIGKRTFALKLAQALLCETNPEAQLAPCGECASCVQVAAGSHPDLEVLQRPDDKSTIPLELLIGDKEHRNREGLCHRISLKPFRGNRKIAIIDDADDLAAEGANCLLKTLEEPPPRSVIILVGTSEQQQLPTIRSRSQIVRFQPLSEENIARLLRENHLVEADANVELLAALSGGSLSRALELNDPQLEEFRALLLDALSRSPMDGLALAQAATQFVDAAGKDAPPRRQRLRQIVGWAADFYRQVLRASSGAEIEGDAVLRRAVEYGVRNVEDEEQVARSLERCLDGLEQIDANANIATLVESWVDDLAHMH